RKERIRMMRIDHICISHLHGDHYLGLPGLVSTFNLLGRTRPLHIYGPNRLKEVLDLHQEVGEGRLDFPLHFHPTSSEEPQVLFEDGSVQLESFPVKHRIPTTGFLLREKEREPGVKRDWVRRYDLVPSEILALKRKEDVVRGDGTRIAYAEACHPVPAVRSYAFAADTRYWEPLAEFIRGVDLLYHEATFDEAMKARAEKTFHSSARQAARIAERAGVGRLVLGHVSARYDRFDSLLEEARAVFPETVMAEDGMMLEVVSCEEIGERGA
ncbi:MAG: ribonuclease Z, partial [Bacteroidota bacterium]|nr:ribonuclease Z [Bacteroidota bacterium]